MSTRALLVTLRKMIPMEDFWSTVYMPCDLMLSGVYMR